MQQAKYYNRSSRDLAALEEGDIVRMKPLIQGQRVWKKALVNKRFDERSYEIETPEATYRRNRVHLRKTNELGNPAALPMNNENPGTATHGMAIQQAPDVGKRATTPPPSPPRTPQNTPTPRADMNKSPVKTRSGRVSKPLPFLSDYVEK